MKRYGGIFIFFVFIGFSYWQNFLPGIEMEQNFRKFLLSMIGIVPAAFVLIGLFEVWVKRETVEKHMGEKAIFRGFFWAIVLAGTIIGGLYVSFPIAAALLKKGARSSVVFTFLFASTICRVPMTVFEANFLGVKFTLVRFLISLPLVIISSLFLGALVDKKRLLLPMIIKE